jgi:hypothetical protein
MEYRIHQYYDTTPRWICCGVPFVARDDTREHLWWVHGQRDATAEVTLPAAQGQRTDKHRAGPAKSQNRA